MQIKQIEIENKIKEKLDKIRPFLKKDGGDAKFVSFKDNIAYIKIIGACQRCIFLKNTFNNEIKKLLIEEIKEVKDVILV